MLPVENCDNVFQTVYGLLPGYHQDVNHNLQIHSSLVQRLSLEKVMEGHQGCVNAVAWNSKGSLLISGSDDTGALVLVIDVGVKEIEGWTARLLPSRQFGYIVLTSAGIMDHEEARRKNVGGKVLGFFY